MTRLNLLLLLLFGFVSAISAQFPLTDIQNIAPYVKFENHGIVQVDGVDYLIESKTNMLRVSEIKEGDVTELYEHTYSSFTLTSHPRNGKFDTRSGFIVHEGYLYEVFTNKIIPRHIPSGEIGDEIKFTAGQLIYLENIHFTENILHFDWSRNFDFTTYNRISEEYNFLPFERGKTYRNGDFYYTSEDDNQIIEYNAFTEETSILFTSPIITMVSSEVDIMGEGGLLFSNFNEAKIINENGIYDFPCFLNFNPLNRINLIENEEHYIVFEESPNDLYISVVNKQNCESIFEESIEKKWDVEAFRLFNDPLFNSDIILFQLHDQQFNQLDIFVLDVETLDLSYFEIPEVTLLDEDNFYRKENKLYNVGLGQDHYDYTGDKTLVSIDLESNQIETLSLSSLLNSNKEHPINFSSSVEENTFLLSKQSSYISIVDFENETNLNKVFTTQDDRNEGIQEIDILGSTDFGLAFHTDNQLYYSQFDWFAEPIKEAEEVSNVIINFSNLEGLVNIDDTTYHYKYHELNDALTLSNLNVLYDVKSNSMVSNEAIFGQFSVEEKVYFDNSTQSFEPIPITGPILSIHNSGEHTLFKSQCGSQICLTSYIQEEFSDFEFAFDNAIDIHPKANGDYFVLEQISQDEQVIYAIDAKGVFKDKIAVNGKKLSSNQENIVKGKLGAMMFQDIEKENVIVIMQASSVFSKFIIPFQDAEEYPLVWSKTEKNLVARSVSQLNSGLYVCTLGKGPNPPRIDDNGFYFFDLLESFEYYNELSILINSDEMQIAVFDTDLQETVLIKPASLNTDIDIVYDSKSVHNKFRTSNTSYVVSFRYEKSMDQYENSDIFRFDLLTKTISLDYDLNDYGHDSNPHNFHEFDDRIYFLARTGSPVNYQLYTISKSSFTAVDENNEMINLEIAFPNPASDFVSLNVSAENIQILNVDGQLVYTQNGYKPEERIDVSNLNAGMYLIAITSGQNRAAAKFLKI